MAFGLTKALAFGFEREEPLNNRYHQHLYLTVTGLAADVDLDIGDFAGTFWTAVGGTPVGAEALKLARDINTRAEACIGVSLSDVSFVQGGAASGKVYTAELQTGTQVPNLAFAAASAPTSYIVCLSWLLKAHTPAILLEV